MGTKKLNIDIKPLMGRIAIISLMMLLETTSSVAFSGVVAYALYLIWGLGDTTYAPIYLLVIFGLVFLALAFAFGLAKDRLSLKLSEHIRESYRNKIFEKALRIGSFKSGTFSKSSLTTISMEGVEELDNFFAGFLPNLLYALFMPLILLALCLTLAFTIPFANPFAWVYGVSMFAIIPFIPLMIGVMSMSIAKVFGKYWDVYLKMGGTFIDSLKGISILKDLAAAKRKGQLLDKQSEDFRKITMKVLTTELISLTILDLLSFGGVGSGIIISLYFGVNLQSLEIWSLALFFILISFQFFIPMRNVASMAMVAGRGMIAYKKIQNFLTLPEGKWGNSRNQSWNIQIKNLSYAYPDSKGTFALKDINMSFEEKGLYGIVGASGSGKSTLAKLLMGALIPTEGKIDYGAIDLSSMDRNWFFNNVALVEGSNNLLSGKIRDAFHFFNPALSDEEMIEKLNELGLFELTENKDVLDYKISEFNQNISLGERQRLILSCVFSSKHHVWILDEISSALDKESRELVDRKITRLSKESLVIMISHTLEETFQAKKIFVMDQGKLVEEGTKEELLNQKGKYLNLYDKEILSGGQL